MRGKTSSLLCDGRSFEVAPHHHPRRSVFIYSELQIEENFVMLVKLLFNGATFKNLNNSKEYIWTALKEVQAFI